MNQAQLRALRRLARREGIQLAYRTIEGKEEVASPETLVATLKALGTPASNPGEVRDAVETARRRNWQRPIEPVVVAWNGRPQPVEIRVPTGRGRPGWIARLILENGQEVPLCATGRAASSSKAAEIDGKTYTTLRLEIPPTPLGYHQLRLETGAGMCECMVLSAPVASYSQSNPSRQWGLFLPTYAAHSRQSWGAGNFRDWWQLTNWTASLGGQVLASLPLSAAFLDGPTCEPSPYAPASRLFWNEFYLDIEDVPEVLQSCKAQRLIHSAEFKRQLAAFRRTHQIDYVAQMGARRRVLELALEAFLSGATARQGSFRRFLFARPEVEQYARFRAAGEQAQSSWHTWPERLRQGILRPGDYDDAARQYHLFVQWLAQEQVDALVDKCRQRNVLVYLDQPLGVHSNGYDVWCHQDLFTLSASVGAPPDPFFNRGQDWGFAPMNPRKMREDQYGHVLEYLRFQMRHTGLLRIDHVMGLHRLYWVAHGLSPTQGAYVTYPADELYALLCLESHRHKTTLVGENLGTVPSEVNQMMHRHQLRQMYVLQYEQQPDSRRPVRPPPRRCVASINTHDMPTFAAHWTGADIADRADLGLIPKGQLGRTQAERRKIKLALSAFLRRHGVLSGKTPAAVLRGCLRWLSASEAEVLLINLEDLWLETLPQNVPGTFRERPNWRRKARLSLEQVQKLASISQLLREINQLRQDT